MTVVDSEFFVKVRDVVSSGWMQGKYHDSTTNCFCLAGAIDNVACGVTGFAPERGDVRWDARDVFCLVGEIDGVTDWNDEPGRTKEEVLRKLDVVIWKLRLEERERYSS